MGQSGEYTRRETLSLNTREEGKVFLHSNLKNKSNFISVISNKDTVATFMRIVLKELERTVILEKQSNVTRKKKDALRGLKFYQSIVIKPAEK